MRLVILVDNYVPNQNDGIYGEPSFCCYIEDKDKRLLFDLGYSNTPYENAEKLNIDVSTINTIVLSHGHLDHTWGFEYFLRIHNNNEKPTIICHPLALKEKRYENERIGIKESEIYWENNANIIKTDTPLNISDGILFLGQIERSNDFENKSPLGEIYINNMYDRDFLFDDSAIVYIGEEGLVIITGCSHSGICNIVEYAKKVTGIQNIKAIIGGFHLQNDVEDEMEIKTVNYLSKQNIESLYPCHCTNLHNKVSLSRKLNIKEIGAGSILEYE